MTSIIRGAAEITATITEYMRSENRPHNAQSVFTNLHGAIPKTQVVGTLAELAKSGVLVELAHGNLKVYHIEQTSLGEVDPAELERLRQDAEAKSALVEERKAECVSLTSEVKRLQSEPRTAAAEEISKELESDIGKLKSELAVLKDAGNLVTADEKKKVETKYNGAVGEWRKRKRMMREVVGAIMENYPKNKKALLEDMGAETDEEAGVDIKAFA